MAKDDEDPAIKAGKKHNERKDIQKRPKKRKGNEGEENRYGEKD